MRWVALAVFLLPALAAAAPVSDVRLGRVVVAEGPEPIGGASLGDSFQVSATWDSDDLRGVGAESIEFDGIVLLDGSLTIEIGAAVFTETDTRGATSFLLFRDGALVGYEYDAPFTTPLGAEYFLSLSGLRLVQSFSSLPPGVEPTRVEGVIVPEPSSVLLLGAGMSALASRRRRGR